MREHKKYKVNRDYRLFNKTDRENSFRITTALIPAAGQGTRLQHLTKDQPKCLVDVNGKPLLAHAIDALEANGFRRLIIITGYKYEKIDKFVEQYETSLEIKTAYNDRYAVTNNIYTLWFAGELIEDPFLLIESDLIFEREAISLMSKPDQIALDRFNSRIHDGTTANITSDGHLASLNLSGTPVTAESLYKTVNMYSFSRSTWKAVKQAIKSRLDEGHTQAYYEQAIRDLIRSVKIQLKIADFSELWWDEIDSVKDLDRVNRHLAVAPIL